MKRLFACAALVAALGAAPAMAEPGLEAWHHADAGMGQFEGRYIAADGGMMVDYGCTGQTTSLNFKVPGNQATKGYGRLAVDGIVVHEGSVTYGSVADTTGMSFEAELNGHDWQKDQVNKIIDAIASGGELTLDLPNLERFAIPLENSARISSCRI